MAAWVVAPCAPRSRPCTAWGCGKQQLRRAKECSRARCALQRAPATRSQLEARFGAGSARGATHAKREGRMLFAAVGSVLAVAAPHLGTSEAVGSTFAAASSAAAVIVLL